MAKKTESQAAKNKAFMRKLERHPDLRERFETILSMAEGSEGQQGFDEVEGLLVEEVRKLGAQTLGGWLSAREAAVARELERTEPGVRQREKKR